MKKYNQNDLNGQGYYADEKHIMMYAAIMFNDPAKVKELIRDGAELNLARNDRHDPPLVYAIKGKKQEIVDLLLENGADPNINEDFFDKLTNEYKNICFSKPLITAVKERNVEATESLLKHGANPHTLDEGKVPALLSTILYGIDGTNEDALKIIQLLINANVDVNFAISEDFSAMKGAVVAKNEMAVDLLLENGGVLGSSDFFMPENFSDNIQIELVAKIEAHALLNSASINITGEPTSSATGKRNRI